jgi:hypothetical protein
MTEQPAVKVEKDQIWKEDDKRYTRFIRVFSVGTREVLVRTCDERGAYVRGTRFSSGDIERFGKPGGYLFVGGVMP